MAIKSAGQTSCRHSAKYEHTDKQATRDRQQEQQKQADIIATVVAAAVNWHLLIDGKRRSASHVHHM